MRLVLLALAGVMATTALCVSSDAATTQGRTARPCGGENPVSPTGSHYTCTFTDDFDGSSVDWSTWTAQDTSFSGMTTAGRDCYVNSPKTVSVSGGAAHISARRTEPFLCHSPFGDFMAHGMVGTLTTYGHFSQSYGRYEFRARFPKASGPGVHSALWLYPQTLKYGAWPASGEIDVAEWFSNHPTYAVPSVHYSGEKIPQSTGLSCTVGDASDWHTYAVSWTHDRMYFYRDDHLCWSYAWAGTSLLGRVAPFDRPFNIVLTQVFGDALNAPTATSPSVATMDVDWVRAWSDPTSTVQSPNVQSTPAQPDPDPVVAEPTKTSPTGPSRPRPHLGKAISKVNTHRRR